MMVAGLVADLRFALRSLRSRPGISLAVLLTLTLGIGANTALFSVVRGVLLRPLPVTDPDQVVMVYQYDRISGTEREPFSVPDYFDLLARGRSFSGTAAFEATPMTLGRDRGEPLRVTATGVTQGFFDLLGAPPVMGRTFTESEDVPGGAKVAVLSNELWRSRFLGDSTILGHSLRLDDAIYTVIGVAPPGLDLPGQATDVWLPLQLGPTSTPRSRHNVMVVGRLSQGASLAGAGREMDALGHQLEAEYPESNRGRGISVEGMTDVVVGGVRPALVLLLGAVALLLLVACANVASLLLAQGWARAREFALRRTLGASTFRLARQFLIESLLVTGTAGALGVGVAIWGLDLLLGLAPADLPRLSEVRVDGAVLAVTLALALSVGLAFGLVPLAQASRLDLHAAVQGDGGRTSSAGPRRRRLRDLLVVAEIAVSALLVIGAGLLLRSLHNLRAVDPGFRTERIVKLDFRLPESRYPQSFDDYPGWSEITGFHQRLVDRIGGIPGVLDAAIAAHHPLAPGFTNSFVIEGRENEYQQQPEIPIRPVTPGYFATMGVPLRRGRMLESRDGAGAPDVLLINQAAARRFFSGRDPLGQRISFWGRSREIVGVVADERFRGLGEDAPPAAYPPIAQVPMSAATLLVRSTSELPTLVPALREAVWSLDPELALSGIEPLDQTLSDSIARPRFTTVLLGGFAALALMLASIGIHGLLGYTVVQRTRELGIRIALGAPRRLVLGQVVGHGLRLAVLGVGLGLLGGLALTRLLRGFLFGVGPTDPAIFAATPIVLAAVALLASGLPARRATRVDPMIALRSE
jgi:putative ABC transport system permease protein